MQHKRSRGWYGSPGSKRWLRVSVKAPYSIDGGGGISPSIGRCHQQRPTSGLDGGRRECGAYALRASKRRNEARSSSHEHRETGGVRVCAHPLYSLNCVQQSPVDPVPFTLHTSSAYAGTSDMGCDVSKHLKHNFIFRIINITNKNWAEGRLQARLGNTRDR